MTIANGRRFLSIPGPTNVPDPVLQAMMRPAEDIYSNAVNDLTESILVDLSKLFRTKHKTHLYIGNGHAAWEAAFTNVLSRGDTVLVLASGRFAIGWGEMAEYMGAKVEVVAGDWRRAVDPAAVEAHLRQDKSHKIKAIMVVQIDTASGVVNDIPAIRKAIDTTNHPALLMVDCVASLGCMPFEMDAWGVDVAMAASQKGLMSPAGLCMVAANTRAREASNSANMKTLYWDWALRDTEPAYRKHCGTPAAHTMFALRAALDMIAAEGAENVWRRHKILAGAVHAACTRWAEGEALAFNITDPNQRSSAVTSMRALKFSPDALRAYTREKCGVTIGVGLGALETTGFRIAHMGHTNMPMVVGTLGAIEMGLKALGVPHGKGGLDAAIEHLAREVPAA